MRRLIPCIGCSRCAVGYETGFAGRRVMLCADRGGREVVDGDGCTLGEPGRPSPACDRYDICIGGHAAVYGRHE